jgi:hypothetical protein
MAGGYLNVPTDSERNFQQRSVDSKGRAGPTLQRIADQYKTHKNNTGMLQSLFEAVAPMGMYSGDAEGAYIPSNVMKNAQTLSKLFQDWYKTGTPTVNVPFDKWPEILKSGKFKNQMELAGKNVPEAWDHRMRVEKKLGGFPYPRSIKGQTEEMDKYYKRLTENVRKFDSLLSNKGKLNFINELIDERRIHRAAPEYSETLAKQNPVYGHIYNPKYTPKHTATGFGDTHAEMSDLVKEQSKYVLGDSFEPVLKTAFSSDDMSGKTSKLERFLFDFSKPYSHRPDPFKNVEENPQHLSNLAPYMEMWIPNHLARLNNIKNVYVPKKASYSEFDQSVAPRNLLPVITKGRKNYENIEDSIPEHLKESIGPEDMWDDEIPF